MKQSLKIIFCISFIFFNLPKINGLKIIQINTDANNCREKTDCLILLDPNSKPTEKLALYTPNQVKYEIWLLEENYIEINIEDGEYDILRSIDSFENNSYERTRKKIRKYLKNDYVILLDSKDGSMNINFKS